MTLLEFGIVEDIERFSNVYPFVFQYTVNIKRLAEFWTGALEVDSEITDRVSTILSVNIRGTERLNKTTSFTDCLSTLESWYYDSAEQTLYINYGTEYNPLLDFGDIQIAFGVCDKKVVYIDDALYLPVIKNAPKIRRMQDLVGYTKLAFDSATIELENREGFVDWLRDASLSNDCAVYYLEDQADDEYLREELSPIAYFIVEDISVGQTGARLNLQDVRKTLNVLLPADTFNTTAYPNIEDNLIDTPIPLTFGTCTVDAVCTNGKKLTGSVTYRASKELTAITSVEVYLEDTRTWSTVTPTATDLTVGSFTLSETDGRGTAGNGARKCRATVTGYSGAKPSTVIKKLELLGNGITDTASFYDQVEITTEETSLEAINLHITQATELYELIRRIQEGSSNRFRYEINAEGLRTIRIDDPERTPEFIYIPRENILEANELDVYTDKPTVAAVIKIVYGTDYTLPRPSVTDNSSEEEVAQNVRERPTITFETFLDTKEKAEARAALEVSRLGRIRRFVDVTLRGREFLELRIYDTIIVELKGLRKDWAGVWLCQILSVSPDLDAEQNAVKLLLVEKQDELDAGRSLRITTSGAIRITEENTERLRVTK